MYPMLPAGQFAVLCLCTFLLACQPAEQSGEWTDTKAVFASPGDSARLLAPSVLSTKLPEFATSWSAEINRLAFNRMDADRESIHIYLSQFEEGRWQEPIRFPHSDSLYRDIDPFLLGERLYFSSDRSPAADSAQSELDIFVSEFRDGQWTAPSPLGEGINTGDTEIFLTATRTGMAYFSSFEAGTRNARIMARDLNQVGQQALPLSFANDSVRLTNPAIAPDGSFLILASGDLDGYGSADLYVSFPEEQVGRWSAPVNLGPKVNSEFVEFAPGISPDGQFLFFTSERPGLVEEWPEGERRPGDLYVIALPPLIQRARMESGSQ